MPGQAVVLRRGVQQQRVVPLPPLVADALVLVQDDAGDAGLAEVVRRRQAGLAGTDDDGAQALGLLLRAGRCRVGPFGDGHVIRRSEREAGGSASGEPCIAPAIGQNCAQVPAWAELCSDAGSQTRPWS